MEKYELVFKRSVAKDLRRLPKKDVKRILDRINLLMTDPRGPGSLRLSGFDRYRVRVGSYRILYEIRDLQLVIVIVKVASRDKAYK